MEQISINAGIAFAVFALFIFYQQIHLRSLEGVKDLLYYLLWVSTGLGAVAGIGWIYLYGRYVAWHAPLIILTITVLVIYLGSFIEKIIPPKFISLVGFIGWPVAAALMFKFVFRGFNLHLF